MNRRWMWIAAPLLATGLVGVGLQAQEKARDLGKLRATKLQGPIEKLAPLLGTWEIDASWSDGNKLWARGEYRVGIGGHFIECNTYALNDSGQVYERYLTVFGYDQQKQQYAAHQFTFDGQTKVMPFELSHENGKLVYLSQWKSGDGPDAPEFKQKIAFVDERRYHWNVWTRKGAGTWEQMMDGEWKAVER